MTHLQGSETVVGGLAQLQGVWVWVRALELTRQGMGGREGGGQPMFSAWAFSGQQYMQETQAQKGGRDHPETQKCSLGGAVV